MLVALAGGIIWYNSRKSSELAVAAAQRLMQEADEKVIERIKLLYDPMYAIVGIASLVPELTTPSVGDDAGAKALLLRALRIYPQILSLYVGFDDGAFFMITHIAGDKAAALRKVLQAPHDAVFAEEIVAAGGGGQGPARWVFLGEDGAVVGRRDKAPPFDPRGRPWYAAAKNTDVVEHSDLYVFASSGEPGFTLSRSFKGPNPGVMGADLAAVDLANFLPATDHAEQHRVHLHQVGQSRRPARPGAAGRGGPRRRRNQGDAAQSRRSARPGDQRPGRGLSRSPDGRAPDGRGSGL